VSDGSWHTAYVTRIGQWVELKVDGGEGRNFNESLGIPNGHREIRLSQRNIFAGGDVRFPSSNSLPLVDYDFVNGNHSRRNLFVLESEISLSELSMNLNTISVADVRAFTFVLS